MNRELAISLVEDLKAELPIPSETCPQIDKVIKTLKSVRASFPVISTHVLPLLECIHMMEELRQDNRALRELGKEYYKLASDLAYQFDDNNEDNE